MPLPHPLQSRATRTQSPGLLPESLTIFFPCYNDAWTIGSLIAAADVVASEYTDDYELIVVDDGSTDQSRALLRELQTKYPKLRLIFHPRNLGYGAALQSGFAHATKSLVFYTDGDGQYDVFELRKLLPIMQDGIAMVNGYKQVRGDPWYRRLLGSAYLWLARLLFNVQVRDVNCDFRLIRRLVFQTVHLRHTSGVIGLELVKKLELARYRVVDVPVRHYRRTCGRSQFFNVRQLWSIGMGVVHLWWELYLPARSVPVGSCK